MLVLALRTITLEQQKVEKWRCRHGHLAPLREEKSLANVT
jgi:hypothetical protein